MVSEDFKFDDVSVPFGAIKGDGYAIPGELMAGSKPFDFHPESEPFKYCAECRKIFGSEIDFDLFAMVIMEFAFFHPDIGIGV